MAVYVNSEGKVLLNASGAPMVCSTCPCDSTACTEYIEGDPDCPGTACCFTAVMPSCYKVTFSGVTSGGSCVDCSEVNQEWTIDFPGACGGGTNFTTSPGLSGCSRLTQIYFDGSFGGCSAGLCGLILYIWLPTGANGEAVRYYGCIDEGYDVTTPIVLDYSSDDGTCTDWPATVTLTPCF